MGSKWLDSRLWDISGEEAARGGDREAQQYERLHRLCAQEG